MKKIRLDAESVRVESFPIAAAEEKPGTVRGFDASRAGDTWCITCVDDTCPSCPPDTSYWVC